jgi:hypothetical protein
MEPYIYRKMSSTLENNALVNVCGDLTPAGPRPKVWNQEMRTFLLQISLRFFGGSFTLNVKILKISLHLNLECVLTLFSLLFFHRR